MRGDGNCYFRCISYLITGDESHYHFIRQAIITHMITIRHQIEHTILPDLSTTVEEYIQQTDMSSDATWATQVEIYVTCSFSPVILDFSSEKKHAELNFSGKLPNEIRY